MTRTERARSVEESREGLVDDLHERRDELDRLRPWRQLRAFPPGGIGRHNGDFQSSDSLVLRKSVGSSLAALSAWVATARLDLVYLHQMSLSMSAHTQKPLIAVMELEIGVITG
jgi:hypothetical protein